MASRLVYGGWALFVFGCLFWAGLGWAGFARIWRGFGTGLGQAWAATSTCWTLGWFGIAWCEHAAMK